MDASKTIKLKVCGMRDANNILQTSALTPDYLGFIFYEKSPRYVGEDFKIPTQFPTNIIRVGVFVNESTDRILQLAEKHNLHFLQLHGAESVKQCEELKAHNLLIIKAFSVDDQMDFEITKYYSEVADFLLFDTKGKHYGGNAKTFNWKVLERYDQRIPFFLSGGIGPENVADISTLSDMNLHAIDVNSGVEVQPAMKDIKKIEVIKNILTKSYSNSKI